MKQLLYSAMIITMSITCFGQGNLIPNGNFENGDHPWNYEVISIAPPWSAFYTSASTNCILNGEAPPGPCIVDHVSQYGSGHPSTVPENLFGYQEARSGQRYAVVSSGACWLEVQGIKVQLSESVVREDIVEFKMYVSQADNYESIGFEVRLSEDGNWSNDDPLVYSSEANNENDWVEHFRQFRLMDLDCCSSSDECCGEFNWLLIKANPNFSSSGMYIDDVSLTKVFDCALQHECLPRTGPVSVLFSMPHSQTFPFCAIGCGNLSHISIEIWNAAGQELIWEFEMEYPPNRICWDGRNASGAQVAAATYLYRVQADAYCTCNKFYEDNFYKQSESPSDDPDYYYNMPLDGCPRPIFCCGIDNESLILDQCEISGYAEYKVRGEITVNGATVLSGSNIHLQAGNRIELENFSTGDNNGFIAEIIPCPSLRLSGEDDEGVAGQFIETSEPNDPIDVGAVEQPILYPNPTTGLITLKHSQTITYMEVFDALGRPIAQQNPTTATATIDLSGHAAGIYSVRAMLEDGSTETHRAVLSPQ